MQTLPRREALHGQPCDAGDSSFLPGGPTLREFTVMTHAPLTPPSTAFCKAQYHGGDAPVCQLPGHLEPFSITAAIHAPLTPLSTAFCNADPDLGPLPQSSGVAE